MLLFKLGSGLPLLPLLAQLMDTVVVAGLYVEVWRHLHPDGPARPLGGEEESLVIRATELTAELGRQWSAAPVAVELARLLEAGGTGSLLTCLRSASY